MQLQMDRPSLRIGEIFDCMWVDAGTHPTAGISSDYDQSLLMHVVVVASAYMTSCPWPGWVVHSSNDAGIGRTAAGDYSDSCSWIRTGNEVSLVAEVWSVLHTSRQQMTTAVRIGNDDDSMSLIHQRLAIHPAGGYRPPSNSYVCPLTRGIEQAPS